jgi:hypothetical protein
MPTIPNRGGVRFVTRCRYLTARCPTGCETWLHPRAVNAHVLLRRCRGNPWIEDVEDEALVRLSTEPLHEPCTSPRSRLPASFWCHGCVTDSMNTDVEP